MRVTVLCGTSPLPVCQAIATLKATEVVLFHGPGLSAAAATRVASYCETHLELTSVARVELPGFVPRDIEPVLFKSKPLLEESDLVYGPGTTPMNVLTYSWWSTAKGNEKRPAWYLASTPPLLHRSGGDELRKITSTGLGLHELIRLNFDLTNATPQVRSSKLRRFNDEDLAWLGRGVTASLYQEKPLGKSLKETLEKNKVRGAAPGIFLEVVAFQFLTRLAEDVGGCKVFHSVKVNEGNKAKEQRNILEVDVVVQKDDRLLVVSCGAWVNGSLTDRRLKFFEVSEQGPRLGGSETRTATLVVDRGLKNRDGAPARASRRSGVIRRHRESVGLPEVPVPNTRHVMVDLAELLGDTPEVTLVRPRDYLRPGTPGRWFVDWFDAYFTG